MRQRAYATNAERQRAWRERKRNDLSALRNEQIGPILKYPGAKTKCATWIIHHLPRTQTYLEPYFGSGAVYFNLPWVPKLVVLNDLDDNIVNLFRVIRDHGEALAMRIAATPWSRAEYEASYQPIDDPIESARRFVVRCWQAHGTKTNQRTGWRNAGPAAGGATVTLWRKLPARLLAIMDRLQMAEIECRPALDVIARYRHPEVLIYCDPPYVLSTRTDELYRHEMTDTDHLALLNTLDAHPGPVILSGYANPLYDDKLAHWHRTSTSSVSEKGGTRTEVLWINKKAMQQQQQHSLFMDLEVAA